MNSTRYLKPFNLEWISIHEHHPSRSLKDAKLVTDVDLERNTEVRLILIKALRALHKKFFRRSDYKEVPGIKLKDLSPHSILTMWWTQPFNGQLLRFKSIFEICRKFDPQIAIETGTFYGTTTVALASLVSEKTYTIERNHEFARYAKSYFEKLGGHSKNIEIIVGDSSIELKAILSLIDNKKRILVYLDAHWGIDVPCKKEISALVEWGGPYIVIVDDFFVGVDTNFGFDIHAGSRIDIGIIPQSFKGKIFVPSYPGDLEFGARRGTCYLFSNEAMTVLADLELPGLQEICI